MPNCRFCGNELHHVFADLGVTPVANAYAREGSSETIYPLCVHICEHCLLAQAQAFETPENIFSDYGYFSSVSKAWLSHCAAYCDLMTREFGIGPNRFVVEVASNDGYLLKNFVSTGVRSLGVEPAKNVAAVAVERGIPTLCAFFGVDTARGIADEHGKADLLIGNNVFAHVPDINDFTAGLSLLLQDDGILTLEFPSLYNLVREGQFDTIYHEHFSYFSLLSAQRVLAKHGLRVFHVQELPTHGGSLRLYACHDGDASKPRRASVDAVLNKEIAAGFDRLETYLQFHETIKVIKRGALRYLLDQKESGKRIAAFGAAAKGSTFLNYCGIAHDLIDYVVDETPYKQGLYMPGVRIPIVPLEHMMDDRPDIVVLLPWNWKDELLTKLHFLRDYGGKAVVFIPDVQELLP